ncbi:IS110 family transposase [Amycolatopsis jiangsuensis]|uniref:Transposase IS110-like N-terminal domain-containing protein n=1 Tax=Amycolatopsis jiangsuensis TaxID=1181879 RepID=A0A840J3F8_9PSEU|nr:transposase [Amycolatopsis jiangsuensis]MBB4689601.1 hypothetical protein [Amycolatopsis jiangsuensis]
MAAPAFGQPTSDITKSGWSTRRWPGLARETPVAPPLTTRLGADGIDPVDVPAKLAARVRMLSTGHGRKNDDADAVSVGIAALTATGLRSTSIDEAIAALRAVVEHRDDVIKQRTQTINRLHALLTKLVPAGAPPS